MGDSITIGTSLVDGFAAADAWPTYACALSGQALRYIRNAGIGGNTTAQMLARFSADVTPYSPKMVSLLAGSNDLMQGVPDSTIRANFRTLVGLIRGIGAEPIICTVPPRTGGESLVADHNAWLRGFAAVEGLRLVDMFSVLASGQAWKAGLDSGDGVHPTPEGYKLMGAEFHRVITPKLGTTFDPNLTTTQSDPQNILSNGIFADGTAVDGVGEGWSTTGPVGNGSRSLEQSSVGWWQVIEITSTGASFGVLQSKTPGTAWNPGDKVRLAFKLIAPAGGSFSGSIVFSGGSGGTYQAARNISRAVNGTFMLDFTVPTGVTSAVVYLVASVIGTYKVSQATWRVLS